MKLYCDWEATVLASSRSGNWNGELREHASRCSVCTDALLIAEFLHEENRLTESEAVSLVSPEGLWWISQWRSQERAMRQATRPIELLRAVAYLASCVTLLWFLVSSAQRSEFFRYSALLQHAFSFAGGYTLVGGASSLLCLAAGSFYSLWGEK
jgi:hypothetical protein